MKNEMVDVIVRNFMLMEVQNTQSLEEATKQINSLEKQITDLQDTIISTQNDKISTLNGDIASIVGLFSLVFTVLSLVSVGGVIYFQYQNRKAVENMKQAKKVMTKAQEMSELARELSESANNINKSAESKLESLQNKIHELDFLTLISKKHNLASARFNTTMGIMTELRHIVTDDKYRSALDKKFDKELAIDEVDQLITDIESIFHSVNTEVDGMYLFAEDNQKVDDSIRAISLMDERLEKLREYENKAKELYSKAIGFLFRLNNGIEE